MKYLRAFLNETFTLVGLFIAWLVLEGTAKEITGWTILATTTIYIATHNFRKEDE